MTHQAIYLLLIMSATFGAIAAIIIWAHIQIIKESEERYEPSAPPTKGEV